jgi:signal transduction histidine kinase
VVLGVVVPLGLVGLWLNTSARRSGEELVRSRLESSLHELVEEIGARWPARLSGLLDLGDAPAVQETLKEGITLTQADNVAALEDLRARWVAADLIESAEIRRPDGTVVAELPADLGLERTSDNLTLGLLAYELPVRERLSGSFLGTLRGQLRIEGLLPPGAVALGVGGASLALFDPRDGSPLVPLAFETDLYLRQRFSWRGESWLTESEEMGDPPLRLVIAGPVEPVTRPFAQAARRGTIALLLVVAGAFGLATLFTTAGDLSGRAEESGGSPEVQSTARAFNDMTRSLSQTLEKLSQQEAVAAVGEFAASLAHEVRNPLTSIRVDLQRADRKMEDNPSEARRLVNRALDELARLNASVDDVLRIARSGRITMSRVDLRLPLEAAVRAAEPKFNERGAILEVDVEPDPVWVTGDDSALEQLVLNLLINAAEALDTGGQAVLKAVRVARPENHGPDLELEVGPEQVTVAVSDGGAGIARDALPQLFEPFFTTKPEGTGLGLAVAQRIARAHGAELEVETMLGEGTTFRFRLAAEPRGMEAGVTAMPMRVGLTIGIGNVVCPSAVRNGATKRHADTI